MEQQHRMRTVALFAALIVVAYAPASSTAQSLEQLKERRESLERQLEQVKTKIAELETTSEQSGEQKKYFIKEFGIDDVNSAGGVEPYFVFFNPDSTQSIKYIDVQLTLFNGVGDVVSSDIGGNTASGIRFTGPLNRSDGDKRADWGPIWYNHSGRCVRVNSVRITYMNGRTLNFAGKSLANAFAPGVENVCRPASKR
jgi:hypothetical protein